MLRNGIDPATQTAHCPRGSGHVVIVVADKDCTLVCAILAGHDGVEGRLHRIAVDLARRRARLSHRLVRQAVSCLRRTGMTLVSPQVRGNE